MESFRQAFDLLVSLDPELLQIIGVTLRMSFFSTTVSCLIGLPLGALIFSIFCCYNIGWGWAR